jgi:hypothetical protein
MCDQKEKDQPVFPHMAADLKKEAYVVYGELPRGEAAIISSVRNRLATKRLVNELTCNVKIC